MKYRLKTPMSPHVAPFCLGLLIAFGSLLGCSKEDLKGINDTLNEQKDKLVKASKELAEEGKELLPETGKIVLGSSPAIETSVGIATIYVVGDGRKNSMQITSYEPGADSTGYPAVFIHATTEIETIALLAGKVIDCNVYVAADSSGTVARNEIGSPIPVAFGSMNMQEKTISASIERCRLVTSDGKPFSIASGQILAVVRGN